MHDLIDNRVSPNHFKSLRVSSTNVFLTTTTMNTNLVFNGVALLLRQLNDPVDDLL